MNSYKRAFISTMQRKVSSFVLFFIIFILANFLLTTLSLNTALKSTKDNVLSQMPPTVTININNEVYEKEQDIPPLTAEMANKLYEKTKSLVSIFDYEQELALYAPNYSKPEIISENLKDKVEAGPSVLSTSDSVFVLGVGTQLNATSLVDSGEAKLINGKGFSDEDLNDGNLKIIVSKQFAEANALEVGNKYKLNNEIFDTDSILAEEEVKSLKTLEYEFEVCGIIQIQSIDDFIVTSEKMSKNKLEIEYYKNANLANQVYIPNQVINKIKKIYSDELVNLGLDEQKEEVVITPKYILKDMKNLDAFTKEVYQIYSKESYSIMSAANAYDITAKPLNNMASLLDSVFIITIIVSVVILSLVLSIFIYLRQKEMGIYLAMGERKRYIIMQLMTETFMITIVAITLAVFTSTVFSSILADNTLQALMIPATDNTNFVNELNQTHTISAEMISQQYQGGYSIVILVTFYLIMFGVIFLSQLTTLLYLLHLNPKKILM